MPLRLLAVTVTSLVSLALSVAPPPAGSVPSGAVAAAMPTINGPADGVVEHDAGTPLTVRYTGASYGWYRLVVACVSAPGAAPARWVEPHLWRGAYRDEVQDFTSPGGLPPDATCSAVVRRAADRAETGPTTFGVVWGEGVLHLEPPSSTRLWPAPEDGGQPLTLVVHVRIAGDYAIRIDDRIDGRIDRVRTHDLGQVEPGRHVWTWDGTRRSGALVAEGRYSVRAEGHYDDAGVSEYAVTPARRVVVRYATEVVTASDRLRERGSRHIDIGSFTLANGPQRATLGYRFRTLRRDALWRLAVGLDVTRLRKGYLLTAARNRRGVLRPTLSLAWLASDVGRPRQVRCRRLGLDLDRRSATFTIPRSCLDRGGRVLRAYYSAQDRHYHYDGGPDRGDYWTPWVTYEKPPG